MDWKTQYCKDVSILIWLIFTLNSSPIKVPASYFVEINRLILKVLWNSKQPTREKTIFKNQNNTRGLNTTKHQDL